MVKKYDIVLVNLDPTQGAEKRGVRPCVVLQSNVINQSRLQTVTIAAFTSTPRAVPSAVWVKASQANGLKSDSRIELSQIRTIDKSRIVKVYGSLESKYHSEISEKIIEFLDLNNENV